MLRTSEGLRQIGSQCVGERAECRDRLTLGLGGLTRLNRVSARYQHPAGLVRLLARLGERHGPETAQAHLLELATPSKEEQPALGPALVHDEVKPLPVRMPAGL